MLKRVLVALHGNDVAARFDLATEILVLFIDSDGEVKDRRTLVLQEASAEKLCHMILSEGIDVVICGGIKEEYYDYLIWKKVRVIDSVAGPADRVLERFNGGELASGDILFDRKARGEDVTEELV